MINCIKNLWELRPRSYVKALEKAEKEIKLEIKKLLNKYYPILVYRVGPRYWEYDCPICNDYMIFPMDYIEDALYKNHLNLNIKCRSCQAEIPITTTDFTHFLELCNKQNKIHNAWQDEVFPCFPPCTIIIGKLNI